MAASPSRVARARLWAEAMQARARRAAERAEAERQRHTSVDAVFEMADRDLEVGGGIIAGALAYRLFIWMLPLALVLVAGLGIAADASSESPKEAAGSLGFSGLITHSINSAGKSPNRWYAILIGLPVLVWATRSMLRALIAAHRLVWLDVRAAAPKASIAATLRLLVLLLGIGVVAVAASAVRASSPLPGVFVTLAAMVPYAGLWLLVSLRLPHRGVDWRALVPGAAVFGVGTEVLNIAIAYLLTPYALQKEGTYGALGMASVLLVALYLISRLMVVAAVANATLCERHGGHRDEE